MSLDSRLRSVAADAGLVGLGICRAGAFEDTDRALVEAVSSGRSGTLGFTFTDPAMSSDPTVSFPWARSIVVTGSSYMPHGGSPGPAQPGTGRIARFAADDHYAPLIDGLDRLAGIIRQAGHRAEVVCDDNRLVDRAVAVRSGIAWWGKSAMVLTPGVGPWMLLGSVVTDAELDVTLPMVRDCGTCDACIPACPTGAIVAPGILDARRCLASVLQSPGDIPLELREPMGDRWYGCDECLTACPPGARLVAAGDRVSGRVSLYEILASADRPLRREYDRFYVPRNQARHLRRNAIVALGNSPDPDADLVLSGYLGHADALLRRHAAWALGRVGGARARAALEYRARVEQQEDVTVEIRLALGSLR